MNKKDKWQMKIKNAKLKMQKTSILWFLSVFCVLCLVLYNSVEAVTPKIWKENSQTAFEKGEVVGLSLTREGTVTLGPQWDLAGDTAEDFVWSLVSDDNGDLYIGTGLEGRVYVLKSGGKTPELIFDAEEETKIFALAIGPDGALYAGTSPQGLIYRIVSGKSAEVFCETGDMHVWSLLWHQNKLYATTGGEQGHILKIAKNKIEVIYQSQDPNIISLTRGQQGDLFAGTDQNGLIYKVSAKGLVSVFYDAGEREVHDVAVSKSGMVYAAAMVGRSENKQNGNGNGEGKKSVLYAIKPSGSALRLWETDDPLLLSVTLDTDGSVRVVTGKKGRVYRIWPDGTYTLLAQLKDVHPWSVLPASDGGLWIGNSGDGQVFKLHSRYESEGMLTSKANDFTLVSHWGQAHWQAEQPAGTSVLLLTRSGNSEVPDDTWSKWSALLKTSGEYITSNSARFLQYRLILKSSSAQITPAVRDVRLAGLQENIAPMIMSVKIDQGDESGDPQRDRRSLWKVSWDAGDVNDDQLFYAVFFREVRASRWMLLKEDLKSTQYIWDTETVPDGTVQIRVVASDRGSNPSAKALSGQSVSAPFEIDNTPPVVKIQSVRQTGVKNIVTGSIIDKTSAILSAKYAVNSGNWQVVFAEDMVFDSAQETLKFEIGQLKPGAYTLVIRAEDVLGNVGIGKTIFEVK